MKFTFRKVFILILLCTGANVSAQRFYSVVFSELPKDFQLYARNDSNIAEIPFTGQIEVTGWDHMSVVTYRNKERYDYNKAPLSYGGKSSASFSMKAEIKAELADYDFEVYACKVGGDSVQIVKRTDVVGGDFYIITGQSNGNAIKYSDYSSKYWRTVARIPDNDPTFGAADTLWIPSAWSHMYVGAWGLEIQKRISESYGIPTCIINGSVPGSKISVHNDRNLNPYSIYGYLYTRIKIANPKRIRAFFWVHGEQEVFENIGNYDTGYDKLFNLWQQDYPMVERFIVGQTNLIFNPVAGEIRDFLRRTKYLYPKTDHFATVGVPEYDGVHYSLNGYREYGGRVFNLLATLIYQSPDTDNIRCPDIRKAFYTTDKRNEITLVFDQGQILKWPADTTIKGQNGSPLLLSLKNLFYLDGDESKEAFASAKVDSNRVILSLKEASNATRITYMPSLLPKNLPLIEPASLNIGWFTGPYLTNKKGLGAFTFNNVTIGEPLIITSFKASESNVGSVFLTWDALAGAASYILEKKVEGETDYKILKTIDGKSVGYEDKDIMGSTLYNYRLQAFSEVSESKTIETSIKFSPILGVEQQSKTDILSVYPNPITDRINIKFKRPLSGNLQLFNEQGQSLLSHNLSLKKEFVINSSQLPAGIYVISIKTNDGAILSWKVAK